MSYLMHLAVYLALYVIGALSLNLVAGYLGLLALSYAAYFAVGSYVTALAMQLLGWSFFAAAALAIAIGMVVSLAVAIPAWRFAGDMFAVVSLAVQMLLFSTFHNWAVPGTELGSLRNMTNGPLGIAAIPRPQLLGLPLAGLPGFAVLAAAAAATCAAVVWLLVASPWGRLLRSVRDDELAARSLGKNARAVKLQAFAISCGMAAMAGALYATYVGYIDPSIAGLDQSILVLSAVIVGGLGNFKGPLVGALTLLLLPELLRVMEITQSQAAALRMLVYGVLLLGIIHFRPNGIAGVYRVE